MEALLMPIIWNALPQHFREFFEKFRSPQVGYDLIVNKNFFVEQLLPGAILRKLTEEEMYQYREPFKAVEGRKLIWTFFNEIPIDGKPADVHQIVTDYNQWYNKQNYQKCYSMQILVIL